MYQAVVFDLYGTLLVYGDMAKAWAAWIVDVQKALALLQVSIDADYLTRHCKGFFRGQPPLVPGLVVYESRLHQLAVQLGGAPSFEWCRETAFASMHDWQKHIDLDPQAIPLLRSLKQQGMVCALVTNFDYPSHIYRLLEELELTSYFETVIISGEVGLKKPDPSIFQLVLSRIHTDPAHVLFVGDHPDQDIGGALQAGIQAILVQRNPEGLRSDHVDVLVQSSSTSVQTTPFQVPVVHDLQGLYSFFHQRVGL